MAKGRINGSAPRMSFLEWLTLKGASLYGKIVEPPTPPCGECGAFHESDGGPCPLVQGGALRAHHDELEAMHAQKIDDRHPRHNTNAVYGKMGNPASRITYPGFRGAIDGRTDSPTYKLDSEVSRICREIESIARELVLRPSKARISELSERMKKATADLDKLVGRLR